MIDRQKILAAAYKLQTFTADLLAGYAQVSRENVYKVVSDRDKRFFLKDVVRRGKRGRPVTQFRVNPAESEALAQEVAKFREDVSEFQTRAVESTDWNEEATADLLVAESYILDQFPEAETEDEKAQMLRHALQHLANDRQLVPSAAESPRRKVDRALLDLSFAELAATQVRQSASYAFAGPAALHDPENTIHILNDIVPEMPNLPRDFEKEVATRLEKSHLFSTPAVADASKYEAIKATLPAKEGKSAAQRAAVSPRELFDRQRPSTGLAAADSPVPQRAAVSPHESSTPSSIADVSDLAKARALVDQVGGVEKAQELLAAIKNSQ